MQLLSTYRELGNIRTQLSILHKQYHEALKADKPFAHTRKIFDEIKLVERQLAKLESEMMATNTRNAKSQVENR